MNDLVKSNENTDYMERDRDARLGRNSDQHKQPGLETRKD